MPQHMWLAAGALQQRRHFGEEVRHGKGLRDIIGSTRPHQADRLIHLGKSGDEDEGQARFVRNETIEKRFAIHVRQPDIADHEIGRVRPCGVKRCLAGFPPGDLVTFKIKSMGDGFAHDRIVLNQSDAHALWRRHALPPALHLAAPSM